MTCVNRTRQKSLDDKFVLRMCARDAQSGTFGKIAPRLKPGSMTLPATVLKSLQRPTHFDTIAVFPEARGLLLIYCSATGGHCLLSVRVRECIAIALDLNDLD